MVRPRVPNFIAARGAEFDLLRRRTRQTVVFAALTGAAVGLIVVAFEHGVVSIALDRLFDAPVWVLAAAPTVGLAVSAVALRVSGANRETSDEYVRWFHGRITVTARETVGKIVAACATLGSGGALGLEGPSIYMGATTGAVVQHRARRFLPDADRRLLMTAGAAAGVAAIFKAPLTGAVFALEVPYQDDLARHMLLPALVASGTSYLTFVAFEGTSPLLPVEGSPPFDLRDLAGAVALGILAGLLARMYVKALRTAKTIAARGHPALRIAAAGTALAACVVAANIWYEAPLAIGPGYNVVEWALDPDQSVWLVLGLFALRTLATSSTVAGGGVGGVFIPLVVAGALLGRAVGGALDALDTSLFLVLGVAAFLGAGYRVPLAAVVFVAEATGRPGFIVPGLFAAVAGELVMGRSSVCPYQQPLEFSTGRGE